MTRWCGLICQTFPRLKSGWSVETPRSKLCCDCRLMHFFARRRIRSFLTTALAVVLIAYWLRWLDVHLNRANYASGYLLYGLVVFLALFNLRKKLPSLPLGSASAWLQLHLYVGIIAGAVFGLHLAW